MIDFVENIKPLSYVGEHVLEIVEYVRDSGSPFIVTQNGEAAAVLMGARQYQDMVNAVNLLKILAIGNKDIKEGRWITQSALDEKVQALL